MRPRTVAAVGGAFLVPVSFVAKDYFEKGQGDVKGFVIVIGVLAFAVFLVIAFSRSDPKDPKD
jgi:hypothetical protein